MECWKGDWVFAHNLCQVLLVGMLFLYLFGMLEKCLFYTHYVNLFHLDKAFLTWVIDRVE